MGKRVPKAIRGMTPDAVIETFGDAGYAKLARTFLKDVELPAEEKFLNRYQRKAILKHLGWEDMMEALAGVTTGKISPVTVRKDVQRNIGMAVVPTGKRKYYFGELLAGHTQEEVFKMLGTPGTVSTGFFEEATRRFYSSPAQQAIEAANFVEANKAPKGPSAARSAEAVAAAWSKFSGKAEEIGNFLGKFPKSADELTSKIHGLMKGSNWVILGAGLLTVGVLSSKAGIHKNTPPNSVEEGYIDEPVKHNKVTSIEDIQHQRVTAKIRGKINSDVDPGVIVNSVHSAIDMHVTNTSSKSHNVQDSREKIDKRKAAKLAAKLLK